MNLCRNPEMACEVALQPLERYPRLDAAILFSDILTIPDAMGLGLYFADGEGPRFNKSVKTDADIDALPVVDPDKDLPYVIDAVHTIYRELNGSVPLIGFSGSPWTLATYMVEGGASRDYRRTKEMLYNYPQRLKVLLDKLVVSVIAYLNAQIDAGAQVIQIFDSWGGALSHRAYQVFSLAPMARIVAALQKQARGMAVPVILFTKGGGQWLEQMATTGVDCLGLDWTTDIGMARRRVGQQVALQGNMDPAVLYARPDVIRSEVDAILTAFGRGSGHIFNLGHGVTPDVDPHNAGVFFDAVHELSVKNHGRDC